MTGFLRTSVLALAFLLAGGNAASAEGPVWCEEDPVFVFGTGKVVDVVTGFGGENVAKIRGAIVFELELPVNAGAAAAAGAAIQVPQEVRISYTLPPYDGGRVIPALVHVSVDADGEFETVTRVTGTAEGVMWVRGRANQRTTIALRFALD